MKMNEAEYQRKLAAVNALWAGDEWALMRRLSIADLDKEAGRNQPEPKPAPAPVLKPRQPESSTDAYIVALTRQYAATMSYADALKRAKAVIRQERGDTPTVAEF